jgi:hypothetical protein
LTPCRPGQILNPGGRPKFRPYAEAAREVAGLTKNQLKVLPTDSAALAAAKVQMQRALRGETSAYNSVADRAEGKPLQMLGDPDGEPLSTPIVNVHFEPSDAFKPE